VVVILGGGGWLWSHWRGVIADEPACAARGSGPSGVQCMSALRLADDMSPYAFANIGLAADGTLLLVHMPAFEVPRGGRCGGRGK